MTASALYRAELEHVRSRPALRFRHRLTLAWLDLDELPDALERGPASARHPAPLRFAREDHWGDPRRPLADCVRDLVEARSGRRPQGPVRLLTQLRHLGTGFTPARFYYCYDAAGERPEAVVTEVTNTPWRERHAYVVSLHGGDGGAAQRCDGGALRHRCDKRFHVSPFMGMDQGYAWHLPPPARRLEVEIDCVREGRPFFRARLTGERRPLRASELWRALLRDPLQPLRLHALIHVHALRLWWVGARFHPHPGRSAAAPTGRGPELAGADAVHPPDRDRSNAAAEATQEVRSR